MSTPAGKSRSVYEDLSVESKYLQALRSMLTTNDKSYNHENMRTTLAHVASRRV